MTPQNLSPWRTEKGEKDEEANGAEQPYLACQRPSHHPPQNHIYFALTRWAFLSCWGLWRESDHRRNRRFGAGFDRQGESPYHLVMPHHIASPSGKLRPCRIERCVTGNKSDAAASLGVSDSPTLEECLRAAGSSVRTGEVAPPRWRASLAKCGSLDTSGRGSWSPAAPTCTPHSRTSPTPSSSARSAHFTILLKMGGSPLFVWLLLLALAGLGGHVGVWASEFPDRECCDSAPPPPPHYHTTTTTTPGPLIRQPASTNPPPPPPSFFPISSISPTGEGAVGVRNCLLARQMCAEDIPCRSVLEIIPRLCGPENVACTTVTVNKCLAALRTILAFPYFQPTCLCREPHLDRECNVFREFIFDHPCSFVENRNKSPYAVDALPLCEYTFTTCEKLPGCMKLYDGFRNACKVKEDQCRMTDTNKCLSSWAKLKMSPMFGCICPNDRQKRRCEKIFRRVHKNPCVAGYSPPPSSRSPALHSTCHTTLQACLRDPMCRSLLDPVLAVCDNHCNREACMSQLKTFYSNVLSKWALDVAFCLCKKSSSELDQCIMAQKKLHPSCARRPAGSAPMLCNRLAADCKEDTICRPRLEFYEQACAVDSDTQRCAGSTAECRRAVLGILGTRLRNVCTCAASDPRETFTCMDWQRILWYNPCVVESQTDYHREMLTTLAPGVEVTTTGSIFMTTTMVVAGEAVQDNGRHHRPPVIHPTFSTPRSHQPPFVPQPTQGYRYTIPSTTTTTTTTAPTTTLPPKFCEKRHAFDDTIDFIEEGWGKRFYKGEECSELCLCHAEEKLACSVLECVEARPCKTDYAVYTHAAPAYQASRGECFCYSGAFICVRPPKGSYDLNYGVFLFLGYSKAEEQLLKPYTKISLVDAAMNKLGDIVEESNSLLNGSTCRLERLLHANENIILQAKLEEYDDNRDNMSFTMLEREKEACEEVVVELGQKINNHAREVREDMALSVLILAEVQVHMPPEPDAASLNHSSPHLLLLLAVLASLHHTLLAS